MSKQNDVTARRKARVRRAIKAVANGRPRLSVHRTGKQIYAQVIDDVNGVTLASASSRDKDVREQIKSGANVEAAGQIGKIVAEQADEAVLTDGKVDYDKLQPIIFDIATMTYRVIGPVVGKAFHDGLKLKG